MRVCGFIFSGFPFGFVLPSRIVHELTGAEPHAALCWVGKRLSKIITFFGNFAFIHTQAAVLQGLKRND